MSETFFLCSVCNRTVSNADESHRCGVITIERSLPDLGPLHKVKIPAGETLTCPQCAMVYVNDRWLAHTPQDCIEHLKAGLAAAKAENYAIRLRACDAHAAVYRAMKAPPAEALAALGDEGYVHQAVHHVLDGPDGTSGYDMPAEVEAHITRLGERALRGEQERDEARAENARLRALVEAAHQLADVAEATATTVTQMLGSTPGTVGHTIAAGLTKAASIVREAIAPLGNLDRQG